MTNALPLFILGNPRSGTSLFRIMLTSHPDICIPPECGFIQWWFNKYKNWSIDDSSNPVKVASYIEDLKTSKKIETWKLDYKTLTNLILYSKVSNYSELSLCVLQQFCNQQNKKTIYLGDKNNYYIHHLDIIHKIYPSAKYIAIIRDGRDVACSYINLSKLESTSKYKPKLPTDIESIAKEWGENNRRILSFGEKIGSKNFYHIKLEDLLTDSQEVLKTICNFLNIDFSFDMMKYPEFNKANKIEPDQLMDWKKKTYLAPDVTGISKYKEELTIGDIKKFQVINSELLDLLGYEKI